MWFVNKDFKVIAGLLTSMRQKGYSNTTVRTPTHQSTLNPIFIDQSIVHLVDHLCDGPSLCLANCLGNASCVGPYVQQSVRHRDIFNRHFLAFHFLGVRRLVWPQVATHQADCWTVHFSYDIRLFLLLRGHIPATFLHVQRLNSHFHVSELHILNDAHLPEDSFVRARRAIPQNRDSRAEYS